MKKEHKLEMKFTPEQTVYISNRLVTKSSSQLSLVVLQYNIPAEQIRTTAMYNRIEELILEFLSIMSKE